MNHCGLASSEGHQNSIWIKYKVHMTWSLVIIHCEATVRAVVLKPQNVLRLPLTLRTTAIKSLGIIKNDTQDQHIYKFLGSMHMSVYIYSCVVWVTHPRPSTLSVVVQGHRGIPLSTVHLQGDQSDARATAQAPFANIIIVLLLLLLYYNNIMSNEPNCSVLNHKSIKPSVTVVIKASAKSSDLFFGLQFSLPLKKNTDEINFWMWAFDDLLCLVFGYSHELVNTGGNASGNI